MPVISDWWNIILDKLTELYVEYDCVVFSQLSFQAITKQPLKLDLRRNPRGFIFLSLHVFAMIFSETRIKHLLKLIKRTNESKDKSLMYHLLRFIQELVVVIQILGDLYK